MTTFIFILVKFLNIHNPPWQLNLKSNSPYSQFKRYDYSIEWIYTCTRNLQVFNQSISQQKFTSLTANKPINFLSFSTKLLNLSMTGHWIDETNWVDWKWNRHQLRKKVEKRKLTTKCSLVFWSTRKHMKPSCSCGLPKSATSVNRTVSKLKIQS